MQCEVRCGTGYLNGKGGICDYHAGYLTNGYPRRIAEWFGMAQDVALCAEAVRWRNEPEALQPAQLLDNCVAHGVPTVNTTSSVTISAETVSATSGAEIDREKMNMATPFAGENTQSRPRIPEPVP